MPNTLQISLDEALRAHVELLEMGAYATWPARDVPIDRGRSRAGDLEQVSVELLRDLPDGPWRYEGPIEILEGEFLDLSTVRVAAAGASGRLQRMIEQDARFARVDVRSVAAGIGGNLVADVRLVFWPAWWIDENGAMPLLRHRAYALALTGDQRTALRLTSDPKALPPALVAIARDAINATALQRALELEFEQDGRPVGAQLEEIREAM